MALRFIALLLSALLLWTTPLAAQVQPASVQLQAADQALDLGPSLLYSVDQTGRIDAPSMFEAIGTGRFQKLPDDSATFGFSPHTYWLHAQIENTAASNDRWLLVLAYPLLDYVSVYVRPNGSSSYESYSSGDRVPFSSRAIAYRHPNFWLHIEQGKKIDVLVRVQSESSIQVPLKLYSPSAFAEIERDAQFGLGIYYGILLALFLYNFVLWIAMRDPSHLWYTFHVGAFGALIFSLNGLGFEYFWPKSPAIANFMIPFMVCLAQLAMLQFTREFLNLKFYWLLGDRLGKAMIAFFTLAIALTPILSYQTIIFWATLAAFPTVILILVQAAVANRRGYAPSKFFLAAWAALLIGDSLYASVSFGLLPKTFFTEYGVQIGSALEMILLSFALAHRYAPTRNENEAMVRNSRERLESLIGERTSELRGALEQLAEANARLTYANQRDSLTGLYNRRYFRSTFNELVLQAKLERKSLGIVMLDLDHFKQINDRYGHLAGDQCLKEISDRLQNSVSWGTSVIARLGGEEFGILLPDISGRQLESLANVICDSIAEQPVVHAGKPITVTTSVGYWLISKDDPEPPEEALRRADLALYGAKAAGRNCVRHFEPSFVSQQSD